MKCKDCANYGCPDRGNGERECIYMNGPYQFFGTPTMPFFDWQSFRSEAAKDILCSVILTFEGKESFDKSLDNAINNSIKAADNLISKLKEKEEK